jgi:hypothetical protein
LKIRILTNNPLNEVLVKILSFIIALTGFFSSFGANAQSDFDSRVCRFYNYTPEYKPKDGPGLYGLMGQVFRGTDGKLYGQGRGKNIVLYGHAFGGYQKILNQGIDVTLAKNSDGSWLMEMSTHGFLSSGRVMKILITGAICDEILAPEKRQTFFDWAFSGSL